MSRQTSRNRSAPHRRAPRFETTQSSVWKVLPLLPFLWFSIFGEALHNHGPGGAALSTTALSESVAAQETQQAGDVQSGFVSSNQSLRAASSARSAHMPDCFACLWSATPFVASSSDAGFWFAVLPRRAAPEVWVTTRGQQRNVSIRGPPFSVEFHLRLT